MEVTETKFNKMIEQADRVLASMGVCDGIAYMTTTYLQGGVEFAEKVEWADDLTEYNVWMRRDDTESFD